MRISWRGRILASYTLRRGRERDCTRRLCVGLQRGIVGRVLNRVELLHFFYKDWHCAELAAFCVVLW